MNCIPTSYYTNTIPTDCVALTHITNTLTGGSHVTMLLAQAHIRAHTHTHTHTQVSILLNDKKYNLA